MPIRIALILILAACITVAPFAWSESTDCLFPVLIVPDGRLTQSTFPQNGTFWYAIYAQANHSYSVEFVPAADNYLSPAHPVFATISIFAPTDVLQGCRGTSSVAVTPNSGYAPVILAGTNGAGRRVSFTAQSAGLYLVTTTDVAATGNYTFRAVDTTLFSARFNTGSGYDAQWSLLNLSDMPILGTITTIDLSGQVIMAVQFSIVPGGRVVRSTAIWDLNLPRNLAGSVMFSHNGPPNSILAEAFMSNGVVTLPEKFDALVPR